MKLRKGSLKIDRYILLFKDNKGIEKDIIIRIVNKTKDDYMTLFSNLSNHAKELINSLNWYSSNGDWQLTEMVNEDKLEEITYE